MTTIRLPAERGGKRSVVLRPRRVRYAENGLRSVPLEKTLGELERFFLASRVEAQYHLIERPSDRLRRAFLKYLSPAGKSGDRVFCGKGLGHRQALASACLEFLERHCAGLRPEDALVQASYDRLGDEALDPRRFGLAAKSAYHPARPIDWVWGFSLTRKSPVLVPANLVFYPYEAAPGVGAIAWMDSNGLASGNNLEEAVLHGLLEVIERDAVMIGEYGGLPQAGISAAGLPDDVRPLLDRLRDGGFRVSFKTAMTDLPFPVVSAFLRHRDRPADCCLAFGCHLDPVLALERALTEAVQVLPPSVRHREWLRSGSPGRHAARPRGETRLSEIPNLASPDLKKNIQTCVEALRKAGSEVIVVDLSLPDIPFPAVRVLATDLQPLLHEDDMRLSPRFFEVPFRLGLRDRPPDRSAIKIWPLCGYR